jgi:hypothetical protein
MLWKSRCVAVCRVTSTGRIRSANPYFHSLTGGAHRVVHGVRVDGFFAPAVGDAAPLDGVPDTAVRRDLLTLRGDRIPVRVEVVADARTQDEIWLVLPCASVNSFALLHDSVEQTVAELAHNLQRVCDAAALASPQTVERIRFSLTLVEQCSREVQKIGSLLRPHREEKRSA